MRKLCIAALATLAFAGCATTPDSGQDDKQAAARSKAYLDGVSFARMGGRLEESASCSVPSDLDKTFGKGQGGGPSKDWRSLIARANTCASDKNWKTLEQLANGMARIDMDSPWGVYYLSLAAEANGEYSRALWMIDQAQKKAGGKAGLYRYQRGHVLLKMGETVKAMAEFHAAVSIEPGLTEGHLYLAEVYNRDLEFDKATTHYRAVLNNDSKNYKALVGLAEVRLQAGATDEAVSLYTKAQSVNSKDSRPWLRLAYIYESVQKNNELALNAYKGLKSTVDSKVKLGFDLNDKIKKLEESVKLSRVPAQASSKSPDEKRKVK